jgi:hypothetical protein
MGKVTPEKIKKVMSQMSDMLLHKTQRFPRLLLHFRPRHHFFERMLPFGDTTDLEQKSFMSGTMFPSLFDGIRLGRSSDSQLRLSETRKPSTSSSAVRIIPIRLSGGQSQRTAKTVNEINPIVLDDDVTELIDCTNEESSVSSNSSVIKKCPSSAIILDDDDSQEVIHLEECPSTSSNSSSQKSSLLPDINTAKINPALNHHTEPTLDTHANKKATNFSGLNHAQPANSIVINNDDVEMDGANNVISRDLSNGCDISGLKIRNGHFEELKESLPPSYPIYEMLEGKLVRENRRIHFITGDGNCFFRALSKIVYGSEEYHMNVRCQVIDIIVRNKSKFAQFIDGQDVQKHIEKMLEDRCWATTCEIYAAATALQTDIFMFTPNHTNTSYSWLIFKPLFKIPQAIQYQCCITLCNTNGIHYDLILPDHGNCNCFLPHPELGGISAVIDLS